MRALILFLLLTACTIFTPSDKNIDPEEIHLLKAILKTVEQEHYAPKALDDSLSIQLYNKFIANLDPEKLLFTSNALESTNAHQYQLDEQLKEHRLDFFDDCLIGLSSCSANSHDDVACPVHRKYEPISKEIYQLFENETIQSLADDIKASNGKIGL